MQLVVVNFLFTYCKFKRFTTNYFLYKTVPSVKRWFCICALKDFHNGDLSWMSHQLSSWQISTHFLQHQKMSLKGKKIEINCIVLLSLLLSLLLLLLQRQEQQTEMMKMTSLFYDWLAIDDWGFSKVQKSVIACSEFSFVLEWLMKRYSNC